MCRGLWVGWADIIVGLGILYMILGVAYFTILVIRLLGGHARQMTPLSGATDWAKLINAVTHLAVSASWLAATLLGVLLLLVGVWVDAGCPVDIRAIQ